MGKKKAPEKVNISEELERLTRESPDDTLRPGFPVIHCGDLGELTKEERKILYG